MYLVVKYVHIAAIMGLMVTAFYAFAAPEAGRKKWVSMFSGILGLVALMTGFHLLAVTKAALGGWVVVKMVCWLGILAFTTLAFRLREKVCLFMTATAVLFLVALGMVLFRPF